MDRRLLPGKRKPPNQKKKTKEEDNDNAESTSDSSSSPSSLSRRQKKAGSSFATPVRTRATENPRRVETYLSEYAPKANTDDDASKYYTRRSVKVCLRLLQDSKFITAFIFSLVLACTVKDLLDVTGVPDINGHDPILQVFLWIITLSWVLEMVSVMIVTRRAYVSSLLWIVDLFALLSILCEFPFWEQRFGPVQNNGRSWLPMLVQSFRGLKCVKLMTYIGGNALRLGGCVAKTTRPSGSLLRAFTWKMPLASVVFAATVFVIPSWKERLEYTEYNYWAFELGRTYRMTKQDITNNVHGKKDPSKFSKTVLSMQKFYKGRSWGPHKLEGFEDLKYDFKDKKDSNFRRNTYNLPVKMHKDHFQENIDTDFTIHFNIETHQKLAAGVHMLKSILFLILYGIMTWQAGKALRVMEKMEVYSTMIKIYLDDGAPADLQNLEPESQGVLKLMGITENNNTQKYQKPCLHSCMKRSGKSYVSSSSRIMLDHDRFEFTSLDVTEAPATHDLCLAEFQDAILEYIFVEAPWSMHFGSCVAEPQILKHFIGNLRGLYYEVPYHSFDHAVDITHQLYLMLARMQVERWLSPVQSWALLIAALGHDVGHLARTNDFIRESRSVLAIKYNDRSPLENMHASTVFKVCENPMADIFKHLDVNEYKMARKTIVDSILHTDVARHSELEKQLRIIYERNAGLCDQEAALYSRDRNRLRDDYRENVLCKNADVLANKAFLHLADIANATKPWALCVKWAIRALEEFFLQGDAERSLGIPLGMLNDRSKVSLPGSQIGFINFLAVPYFLAVTEISQPIYPYVSELLRNLREWRDVWVKDDSPDIAEIRKRDEFINKLRGQADLLRLRGSKKKGGG